MEATGLTARELETLRLLAKGNQNKEIARTLNISEKTVANKLDAIYEKLGVSDRLDAVRIAIKQGLINPFVDL